MPDPTQTQPGTPLVQKLLRAIGLIAFAGATFIVLVLLASSREASLLQKFWMIAGWMLAAGAVAVSYLAALRARGQPQAVPAIVIFDAVSFLAAGLLVVSFWSGPDARTWAATIIWSFAFIAMGGVTGFLFGVPRSRREAQRTMGTTRPPVSTPSPAPPAPTAAGGGVFPTTTAAASSETATVPQTNPAPQTNNDTAVAEAAGQPVEPIPASNSDESPIEQISDWLTKIIVGLGLVNLKALPPKLQELAYYVSQSITPTGATPGSGPSFALGLIIYFSIFGFMGCYILTQMFLLDFVNKFRNN